MFLFSFIHIKFMLPYIRIRTPILKEMFTNSDLFTRHVLMCNLCFSPELQT